MLLNCGVGKDSWECLGLQGDPTSPSQQRSVLGVHWKDWCWSWNSNSLATWCEELTHWKRPWCWERVKLGRKGNERGGDGCMASSMQVWAGSGSWWWTGKPGMLQSMGLQRVRYDWETELNWISKDQFKWPVSKCTCFWFSWLSILIIVKNLAHQYSSECSCSHPTVFHCKVSGRIYW